MRDAVGIGGRQVSQIGRRIPVTRREKATHQIHPFQRQSDAVNNRSDQPGESLPDNTVTTNMSG